MSFSFMYRGVLYVHHVHVGGCGKQKNALDPLKLKLQRLQVITWVLGTKPGLSTKTSTFNS